MELLELTANIREKTGKGAGRSLRREGMIPGVLYGPRTEPMILSLEIAEVEKFLKKTGGSQVPMNLTIKNGEAIKKTAMIKELQVHPVTSRFVHVDLYEVAMDQKIQVKVSIEVSGKAKGVEDGGTLQLIRREVDVLCLPKDIPESIVVDVTDVEIGGSIHVEEIPVPEGIELMADFNYTVISVAGRTVEALPEEEGEEEGEGAEEGATEEKSEGEE